MNVKPISHVFPVLVLQNLWWWISVTLVICLDLRNKFSELRKTTLRATDAIEVCSTNNGVNAIF